MKKWIGMRGFTHSFQSQQLFIVSWRVQFFSNLGKHRNKVSNLCSARRAKLLWRKILFPWGQRKVRFFSRTANFGNVSPFLVGATNIFSELIHSLLKFAELCFEILQFIRSTRLFQLTPPSRSRHGLCWRTPTATSTHFWSSTLYTTFQRETMLKTALELLDTASRFEAKCRQ